MRLVVIFNRHILGCANLVVRRHVKERVVRQCVAVMVVVAVQVEKYFRCPREPQLGFGFLEFHGTVVDRNVIPRQFQFLHWVTQIGFNVQHIETVRGYPYAAFEWNFHRPNLCLPKPKKRPLSRFLREVQNLNRFSPPLPQAFTLERKRFGKAGLEKVDAETNQPDGCQRRGELIDPRPAIPLFVQV